MSIYNCVACGQRKDGDFISCYEVTDTNELICEDCLGQYVDAYEERHGQKPENYYTLPTFDRELFDDYATPVYSWPLDSDEEA